MQKNKWHTQFSIWLFYCYIHRTGPVFSLCINAIPLAFGRHF